MSLSKRLLSAAVVAAASANVMADRVSGTWQYEDAHVSMRLRLADDGTCRLNAKSIKGPSVGALCEYTLYGRVLIIDWPPGIPVNGFVIPDPLRLYFDPDAEFFEMDGEPQRVLTRSTGLKG